jgi:hypothetical protein
VLASPGGTSGGSGGGEDEGEEGWRPAAVGFLPGRSLGSDMGVLQLKKWFTHYNEKRILMFM